MEKTSTAWRENQENQLTNEAFVEVSYKISDPNIAKAEAHANNNEELFLSDLPALIDGADYDTVSYATLEPDIWLLDGARKHAVPSNGDYKYSGFVSCSHCSAEKLFAPNLLISIEFGENVPLLPGLTIIWDQADKEYPTEFEIIINDEEKTTIHPSSNKNIVYVLNSELKNFNRIDIKIIKWSHEFRRARIEKIVMGISKVYTKNELLKFSCAQAIDPISATLPKYEISFELDNHDDMFNPYNQEGLTKYMMEWQEIRTRYGFKLDNNLVEWIPGGVYYLSDWSAPLNGWSATLTARDILGLMGSTFYKGVFPNLKETPRGTNLYDLAEQVLQESHLPKYRNGEQRWQLSNRLGSFYTLSPLPVCSTAECLQLIANAAGCTIIYDRHGRIHIIPLEETKKSEEAEQMQITKDNSYSKAEINLSKPIKQVDISMFSYAADAEKDIYSATLNLIQGKNEFLIEYSDTAKDIKLELSNKDVTVSEDTQYYAKCCKLVLNAQNSCTCDVNIKGTVYKTNETLISVQNKQSSSTGETHTLKNVLITSDYHAKETGISLLAYLNHRMSISADLRIDPRLDVSDSVSVENNIHNKMCVTSSSFSFSGAFKGKCEGTVIEDEPDMGTPDYKQM